MRILTHYRCWCISYPTLCRHYFNYNSVASYNVSTHLITIFYMLPDKKTFWVSHIHSEWTGYFGLDLLLSRPLSVTFLCNISAQWMKWALTHGSVCWIPFSSSVLVPTGVPIYSAATRDGHGLVHGPNFVMNQGHGLWAWTGPSQHHRPPRWLWEVCAGAKLSHTIVMVVGLGEGN